MTKTENQILKNCMMSLFNSCLGEFSNVYRRAIDEVGNNNVEKDAIEKKYVCESVQLFLQKISQMNQENLEKEQ